MVTHKVHNGGAQGIMDRLKNLSSQKVCVGIPADKDERGENQGDDGIGNADLAYIHTHGVRPRGVREAMQPEINQGVKYSEALQMYIHEHGSFTMQVPPRPIIEPAIQSASEDIGELLGEAAKQAADGSDIEKPLHDVGLYAQSAVQEWFVNSENGWAPNSPSTAKRKKSDKPLIDTGSLRKSITYVIRGADE